ncbi:MAG: hypothetical protein EOM51_06145 [Clostridia bacterium]|nr:hypothetical protein [Clostridia bacterium]
MKKIVSLFLIFCLVLSVCPMNSFAAQVSDFSDVRSIDWFYSSIKFVTDNGMFNGTSSSTFSPNASMTRGMFVTVLGRYGGAPSVSSGASLGTVLKSDVNLRSAPSSVNTSVVAVLQTGAQVEVLDTAADLKDPAYTWYYVKYKGALGYIRSDLMEVSESGFTDVSPDSYYSSYVQWAFSSGIAGATGDDTFSPERNITREEICSMLYNYVDFKNYQLKASLPAVTFSDSSAISSDYKAAVSTMQLCGVVLGYGDGSFRPSGSATRAEVSTMLMRFIDTISYKKVSESSYDSAGNYIFGTEVPQKTAITADYFSDACFIGHSLVCGMQNYFGLSDTDFYAVNGISAKSMLTYSDFELSTTHTDESGNTVSDTGVLDAALAEHSYAKVYIMLGVNELGPEAYHRQSYYNSMSSLIDLVRNTQPNATIYLISLSPVSQKCSESRESFTRDNAIAFNAVIKQLCKEKNTYYLNVFDLLCNSNGFLPESSCMTDGIHLLASEYAKIKTYLFTHTV